jgi:hypothetical protein
VEWYWRNLCGKDRQNAQSVSSAMSQAYCESIVHYFQNNPVLIDPLKFPLTIALGKSLMTSVEKRRTTRLRLLS